MFVRVLTVVSVFVSALVVLYWLGKWTVEDSGGGGGEGKDQPRGDVADGDTHSPSHHLYFPSNLAELKEVVGTLSNVNVYRVLPLFCMAYVFKQTFAIPGSMLLNLLAGALFGAHLGFLLTCTLTAAGATFCYLLAKFVGRDVAEKYFPKVTTKFKQQMDSNQNRLPYYLLFLRLFPCSPNWALNMCSGVMGIPITVFFATVFVGLMPYNYICVQTGAMLTTVRSISDVLTLTTMLQLTAIALVALAPSLFVRSCSNSNSATKNSSSTKSDYVAVHKM